MGNNGPTSNELFNKLMDIVDKTSAIQEKDALAMTEMAGELRELRLLLNSKLWWVIAACLFIAAGAIGIKLAFPG